MKILYIPAKLDFNVQNIKNINLKEKTIALVSTIQYLHKLEEIKKILSKKYKVFISGQILGCNIKNTEKMKNKADAFLFIGSKEFHPISLKLKTNKPVYVFDPSSNNLSEILDEEAKKIKQHIKGKYIKFLNAKKIGILVSLKPGQFNLNQALKLKKQLKKESYIFISNTLNLNELENFKDIDIFINTACPRIESNKIINIEDLNFQ